MVKCVSQKEVSNPIKVLKCQMKYLSILTILFFIFSCSNKANFKGSNHDSLQTNKIDTFNTINNVLNENIQYINFIYNFYFSKENEVYIELDLIKEVKTADEYYKIAKLADSLIYKDEDNSRHRFPLSLATKYFDLRGISKLKIYDNNHKFISNADFVRVEFLNQNIQSPFIAVYKTEKYIKEDNHYCRSNFNGTFEPTNYSVTTDTILTQELLTKIDEKIPYYGIGNDASHFHFFNSDTILSVINSEKVVYIVLSTSNDFKVLYRSSDSENVYHINIIPLIKNGLPYLLIKNVWPEGDSRWDILLCFDGTKYTEVKSKRIEK